MERYVPALVPGIISDSKRLPTRQMKSEFNRQCIVYDELHCLRAVDQITRSFSQPIKWTNIQRPTSDGHRPIHFSSYLHLISLTFSFPLLHCLGPPLFPHPVLPSIAAKLAVIKQARGGRAIAAFIIRILSTLEHGERDDRNKTSTVVKLTSPSLPLGSAPAKSYAYIVNYLLPFVSIPRTVAQMCTNRKCCQPPLIRAVTSVHDTKETQKTQ